MSTSGAGRHSSSAADQEEYNSARIRSYDLLERAQVVPCPDEITELLRLAEQRGWPEVECLLHYARFAMDDDIGGTGEQHVKAMISAAERSADDALVAAGFAARALALAPEHSPSTEAAKDRDLAQAVALLDEVGEESTHRAVAYIGCGLAYHRRGLWELAISMYDRAAAAVAALSLSPLVAIAERNRRVIVVNRIDAVVPLACTLLELGRRIEARDLALHQSRLTHRDLELLPDQWIYEAQAVQQLLAAIAQEPEPASSAALLDRLHPTQRQGYRACVLLSQAIRAIDAGEVLAASAHAEAALNHIDEEFAAGLEGLVLNLAAAGEHHAEATRRYARHQLRAGWRARVAVLEAARAQIEAERVMLDNYRLSQRVYLDELTGLANRHAYARHITRLRQTAPDEELAAFMVDVDRFKEVNDTHGHVVGDEVLRVLGRVLLEHTRASDLAVRLGGDEFLLLLTGRTLPDVAQRAQQLLHSVREHPWVRLAPGLAVSVSIGVTVGHAVDVDALVSSADRNLYQAKADGRGRVVDSGSGTVER